MYQEISACRVCGNKNLRSVLSLGEQSLTGVFPRSKNERLTSGPLELVKCEGEQVCGLLQLKHSYTLSEMYGKNYGYRSGLNASMVAHLASKVENIESLGLLKKGDIVLDIGSNDGTTLSLYKGEELIRVGMDPTIEKFRNFYAPGIFAIADFFDAATFKMHLGKRQAKVITSFSMFYDLENPVGFVKEVAEVLSSDGIWVLEQSYMPLMLETNSYDTVCHEHLEYYSLKQINWIVKQCGLQVVDVEQNDVNGGSFSLVVQKLGGPLSVSNSVQIMTQIEESSELDDISTFDAFDERAKQSKNMFKIFLQEAKEEGKSVVALGASTKGNVILQYCEVTSDMISAVGEVNKDKFGTFTPGTYLPILDEVEVLAKKPDYVVVLPWHFRKFFEAQKRYDHLNLVFPLPKLEVRMAK